jgi:hypothetical protein
MWHILASVWPMLHTWKLYFQWMGTTCTSQTCHMDTQPKLANRFDDFHVLMLQPRRVCGMLETLLHQILGMGTEGSARVRMAMHHLIKLLVKGSNCST